MSPTGHVLSNQVGLIVGVANKRSLAWAIARAAAGLAHCIVSATAFLDLDAVVVDGAAAPELLQTLCESARHALSRHIAHARAISLRG